MEIAKFIWESMPLSLQLEALEVSNFAVYRLAIRNKHFHIIDFIESKSDKKMIKEMKMAVNQGIFSPK